MASGIHARAQCPATLAGIQRVNIANLRGKHGQRLCRMDEITFEGRPVKYKVVRTNGPQSCVV